MTHFRLFGHKGKTWKKRRRNLFRNLLVVGVSLMAILAGIRIKNSVAERETATGEENLPSGGQMPGQVLSASLHSGKKKTGANYYRKLYQGRRAATVVSMADADKKQIRRMFYPAKISDSVFKRMYKKSYKKCCTVPKNDLRYVRVLYYGFDQKTHIGELVVNRKIAKEICAIFYQLYQEKYPIEKMVLVDEYNAVDEDSMADNNTSGFNFRPVSGTSRLSRHSYGMAVDVNPLYNPYLHMIQGKRVCEPAMGKKYSDRSKSFAHKIDQKDLCYKLFTRYGFTWGGSWKSVKDYQHFEKRGK